MDLSPDASMNARRLVARLTNILLASYGRALLEKRLDEAKLKKDRHDNWLKVIRGCVKVTDQNDIFK